MKLQPVLLEVITFLFVLLFVYAALNKLLDYETFVVQIGRSPLLTGLENIVPWSVIGVELLISLMLIIPRFRMVGYFGAFGLMTMFTTYIIFILNYSSFVPCSCGGVLESLGWTEHLIFNSVFVVLGLVAIILQYRSKSINVHSHHDVPPTPSAT